MIFCPECKKPNIETETHQKELIDQHSCMDCGHEWQLQILCVNITIRMSASQYNRMFWAIHSEQMNLTELGDEQGAAELDAVIDSIKEEKLLCSKS